MSPRYLLLGAFARPLLSEVENRQSREADMETVGPLLGRRRVVVGGEYARRR